MGVLANMNAYARSVSSVQVQTWVVQHLNQLMDDMCNFKNLGQSYTSPQSSEIGF